MRTMITVMAMITPVMPVRAEIRYIGCAGSLRLRRCRGRIDCRLAESHERNRDKGCRNPALHDGLLLQLTWIARSNLAEFVAARKTKQARNEAACSRAWPSQSPAVPVTVMMAVMMMPAVPTMMVMEMMMAVVSPMHLRRRQPGIFLNGRRSAGIAQRERVRALGRGCEREQCARTRRGTSS